MYIAADRINLKEVICRSTLDIVKQCLFSENEIYYPTFYI